MNNEKLIELYDKLFNNLNTIFCSSSTRPHYDNYDFRDVVSKQLSILKYLNQVLNKDSEKYQEKIDEYKVLTKSEPKIEELSLSSSEEIEDEINYLVVFCRNTFDIDINDIKADLKSPLIFDGGFESKANENQQANNTNQNYSSENNNINDKNRVTYQDIELSKSQIKINIVNKKIQEDRLSGDYYFYKTKPKQIPIIKFIYGIICFIIGLCLTASAILGIVSSSNLVILDNNKNKISSGVDFFSVILTFILVFLCFYFGIKLIGQRSVKNDNIKYSVSSTIYVIIAFGFLFAIINIIPSAKYIAEFETYKKAFIDGGSSPEWINVLFITLLLKISLFSFVIFSNIVVSIILYIFKPEQDLNLILKLREKYLKEIDEIQDKSKF